MATNKGWDVINREKLALLLNVKKNPEVLDYEIKRLKQIMDKEEYDKVKRENDAELD